jgi:hypothetical protein
MRGEVQHWNRLLNDSFDFVYIFADLGLIDFAPSDLSDFYSKVVVKFNHKQIMLSLTT